MKDIQIKKMQSDDDFYVELRKICLDWQQKGISEEVKDIICDIIIYDSYYTKVFISEELLNQMQYGFTKMMIRKLLEYNNNSEYVTTILQLLRSRFKVTGEIMYEIKNIIDEHKNIEKLRPLFKLIDAFDMLINDYEEYEKMHYNIDVEGEKESCYNTIYVNTVNIRNILIETEEDNKEIINVLNKIIDVFIESNY